MRRIKKPRSFSRKFILKIVMRMEAGENVSALAREVGVARAKLYSWRDAVHAGGERALCDRCGHPTMAQAAAIEGAREPSQEAWHLAEAQRMIADLERKVGRMQLELDSLKETLRFIEASCGPGNALGAHACSRGSEP